MKGSQRHGRLIAGLVLAACLVSALSCPGAWAEPVVSVQYAYYPVSGVTPAQIRAALDRNTPVRQNEKAFDAYTRWNVAWQFAWASDGDGACRIATVSTTVRIRYTLPRLQADEDRPPEVQNRWERYFAALVAHEEGHAALGLEAAREIEHRFAQLGKRPSCSLLEADANTLAQAIIARYASREDGYDAETDHGARGGARFP